MPPRPFRAWRTAKGKPPPGRIAVGSKAPQHALIQGVHDRHSLCWAIAAAFTGEVIEVDAGLHLGTA